MEQSRIELVLNRAASVHAFELCAAESAKGRPFIVPIVLLVSPCCNGVYIALRSFDRPPAGTAPDEAPRHVLVVVVLSDGEDTNGMVTLQARQRRIDGTPVMRW